MVAAPVRFKKTRQATIPMPDMTLESVHQSVVAMKQLVESLTGTRGQTPSTRVFVQETQPAAFNVGDFWIYSVAVPPMMFYWDGSGWRQLVPSP